MGPTDPRIVSIHEVHAARDLCVRLAESCELPSRYIPRWLEITCCTDVERNREMAYVGPSGCS